MDGHRVQVALEDFESRTALSDPPWMTAALTKK